METSSKVLGAKGEDAACRWYADRGYTIVDRNWRVRLDEMVGEIDLIVHRGGADGVSTGTDTIVFCEVKTRSSRRYGMPFEAVGANKQVRLRRLAAAWLAEHPGHRHVRFDVASVMNTRVEVIEAAF